MKIQRQIYKANIMKIVKTIVFILVLFTVETVLGIAVIEQVKSVAYGGVLGGYSAEIKRVGARIDDLFFAGKSLSPDFFGRLSGFSLIIDGNRYTTDENTERNLKSRSVGVYTLAELCSDGSADEFIYSDDTVYVVYVTENGDGLDLSFKSLSDLTADFSLSGFEGLVLFSESGRVVFSKDGDGFGDGFTDDLNYKTKLPEDGFDAQTVKSQNGKTYVLATCALESGNLFIGGYADFSVGYAETVSAIRLIITAFVVFGIIAAAFIIAGAYVSGGVRLDSAVYYRFKTDGDGKIIDADKSFKSDFPDVKEIRGRVSRFDENSSYAIALPQNGENALLSCTLEKRFDGTVDFTARKLSLPFGTDMETERKDNMNDVYKSLSAEPQLLVGEIYFDNIQEIKNAFGRKFTDDVRNIIVGRVKKHFGYVFGFDYYNLGVIQPSGKRLQTLLRDMESVVSEFNRTVKTGYNAVLISVKCGFALVDANMDSRDFDYVMSAADAALKRAIESRSDDVNHKDFYIYRESQKKLYAAYTFKIDVAKMLENGDFYLEYQPQYSLKENRISGFEALFRVNKRVSLNATMSEIINYAERSGNMVVLGEFIFNEGMKFARSIQGKGVTVSLNVSPIQLMQTGFVDNFLKIYDFYDLKPDSISIEITESYLMRAKEEALKKLEILKSHGIEIHLDDFGTQYASFNYLKELPISAIKIDKSFIKDIEENEFSEFITATIINISKNLRLKSICEGVETASQLERVKAHGCDIIQGFLISKSVDESAAREMIDTYRYKPETEK